MKLNEPEGWRPLWLLAQHERDPKRLAVLIDELNLLLDQQMKQMREAEFPGSSKQRKSPHNSSGLRERQAI